MSTTVGSKLGAWGSQLEASSIPTSYIPTTTAIATRQADVVSLTMANATYDILVEDASGSEWRNSIVVSGGLYGLLPRPGQTHVTRVRAWTHGVLSNAQKQAIAPNASTAGATGSTPTIGSGNLLNTAASAISPAPILPNDGAGNWKAVMNLTFGSTTSGTINDPTLTTMQQLVANCHCYYPPFANGNNNQFYSFIYLPPEAVAAGDNPYSLPVYNTAQANLSIQPAAVRNTIFYLGTTAPTTTGTGFISGNESCGHITPLITFANPVATGHDLFIEASFMLNGSAAHSADLRYYWLSFWLSDNHGTDVKILESIGYDAGSGTTNFTATGTAIVRSYWKDWGNGGFTQVNSPTDTPSTWTACTPAGIDLKQTTTAGILLKANGTWSTYVKNAGAAVTNFVMNSGTYTSSALSQGNFYIYMTGAWGANTANDTPTTTNPVDATFFPYSVDTSYIRSWMR